MKRSQILNDIKQKCEREYAKIDNWVHDIHHIQIVVKNGHKIAKKEGLKSKDAFLLELACWLHDLGRVDEAIGLEFLESNHAEGSYIKSKKILKPYAKRLGRESVYLVLQAVREHNLPWPKHPDNRILRWLMDSDRGAGLRIAGVFSMLNYLGLAKTEPVYTNVRARELLPQLTQQLIKTHNVSKAIEKLRFYEGWYYGCEKQPSSGVRVIPLYTQAAKQMYKKGWEEISAYIEKLKEINR